MGRISSTILFSAAVYTQAPAVVAATEPVWSVYDEALPTPIGVIEDAAVSPAGITYLLDTQQMIVHVFGPDGSCLPARGGVGGGPEEYYHPKRLAVYSGERCVVFQDFHARAVCLPPDDVPCDPIPTSEIYAAWYFTQFYRIQLTPAGDAVVGMVRNLARHSDGRDPTTSGMSAALTLVSHRDGSFRDLACSDGGDPRALPLSAATGPHWVRFGWDMWVNGTIVARDDHDHSSVVLVAGSDAAFSRLQIDLPGWVVEARDLVAASQGISPEVLPVIERIAWVDSGHFMVRPVAIGLHGQPQRGIGTWLVYDLTGALVSRLEFDGIMDPEEDQYFLSLGRLVIVSGGLLAQTARIDRLRRVIGEEPEGPVAGPGWESVRVSHYRVVDCISDAK